MRYGCGKVRGDERVQRNAHARMIPKGSGTPILSSVEWKGESIFAFMAQLVAACITNTNTSPHSSVQVFGAGSSAGLLSRFKG